MKSLRLTLLVGLLLFSASPLLAQKGLKLGGFFLPQVSGLYNADDMALDADEYQLQALPGMAGGLQVGYHFNDMFGVRLNVIYSQEGGRYAARRDFASQNVFTTRLEYLKLPLLIGFNTDPLFNKVMFAAYGGIQGNLLTRAYTYNNNPALLPQNPPDAYRVPSVMQQYQRWTYSAVLDLGVDIFLTSKATLNLRLRSDLGLIDSEDKTATYLRATGGESSELPYWPWARGAERAAETFSVNSGLLIGLTYTLGGETTVPATPPAAPPMGN